MKRLLQNRAILILIFCLGSTVPAMAAEKNYDEIFYGNLQALDFYNSKAEVTVDGEIFLLSSSTNIQVCGITDSIASLQKDANIQKGMRIVVIPATDGTIAEIEFCCE